MSLVADSISKETFRIRSRKLPESSSSWRNTSNCFSSTLMVGERAASEPSPLAIEVKGEGLAEKTAARWRSGMREWRTWRWWLGFTEREENASVTLIALRNTVFMFAADRLLLEDLFVFIKCTFFVDGMK